MERRHPHGPDGLLICLGWGSSWFERHTPLPSPIGRPLPMAARENPKLEDFDACLHLATDHEPRLAEVPDVLFGPGDHDQRPRLALREIRSGFVGADLVTERVAVASVPRDAPLLLGFHSGLRGNQAPETAITIPDGPLAGGTTMHVSRIHLDLDRWYALNIQRRAALMFSPATTPGAAAAFTTDALSDADRLPALAARHGLVGHAQAAGRARLRGHPRINRRDFATIDDGRAGTHFVALQRTLQDFNATRAVMNAADARAHNPAIGERRANGINAFMTVTSRATFAVPSRRLRAYPYLHATRDH